MFYFPLYVRTWDILLIIRYATTKNIFVSNQSLSWWRVWSIHKYIDKFQWCKWGAGSSRWNSEEGSRKLFQVKKCVPKSWFSWTHSSLRSNNYLSSLLEGRLPHQDPCRAGQATAAVARIAGTISCTLLDLDSLIVSMQVKAPTVTVCNVAINDDHLEFDEISTFFPSILLHQNKSKSNLQLTEIQKRKKEKSDFVGCVQQELRAHDVSLLLVLEDDALIHPDFFHNLYSILDFHLPRYSLDQWIDIKLFYPPKWTGYGLDLIPIIDIFATSGLLAILLLSVCLCLTRCTLLWVILTHHYTKLFLGLLLEDYLIPNLCPT